MCDLYLAEVSREHEKAAMEYRQEYIDCGEKHIHGSCGFTRYPGFGEWLEAVVKAKNAETSVFHVPATTYFSVRKSDNKIIGTIQIRHYLNEGLEKSGGHIGYGIRPSERKKGYGARQLSLALEKARELQIPRVMISCDRDNYASAKTALKNGAVFTREGFDPEDCSPILVFWIDL